MIGIVDDRGKEIGGDNQGAFFVETPNGGIIGIANANQEIGIIFGLIYILNGAQNLRQRFSA